MLINAFISVRDDVSAAVTEFLNTYLSAESPRVLSSREDKVGHHEKKKKLLFEFYRFDSLLLCVIDFYF